MTGLNYAPDRDNDIGAAPPTTLPIKLSSYRSNCLSTPYLVPRNQDSIIYQYYLVMTEALELTDLKSPSQCSLSLSLHTGLEY